jgi:hypothetical protein
MPPDFRNFLEESLSDISLNEPEAHSALREALGSLSARLTSENGAFTIAASDAGWTFGEGDADVAVAFDAATVLDLVDGALTLTEAIEAERLRIIGSVAAVAAFYDALLVYLEGLLRAPGAPELLRRYRESLAPAKAGAFTAAAKTV